MWGIRMTRRYQATRKYQRSRATWGPRTIRSRLHLQFCRRKGHPTGGGAGRGAVLLLEPEDDVAEISQGDQLIQWMEEHKRAGGKGGADTGCTD